MLHRETDNVYVNVTIANTTNTTLPSTTFTANYEQVIIEDPSQYYLSVTDFVIPLASLPLFVFPTKPEQLLTVGICGASSDPLLTYTGIDTQVIYTNPFGSISDYTYNYIYRYQYFIDLVNTALLASWTAVGSPGGPGNFPYFIRDNEGDGLIKLVLPQAFTDDVSISPNGNTVYWNTGLQLYLQSFNVQLSNRQCTADPSSGRFELLKDSFAYDVSITAPTPPYPINTYLISQEYPTNDYLNSVRKLVITSHSLPTRMELYPVPASPFSNDGAFNTVPIIKDFNLELSNKGGNQRSVAIYDADVYHLSDLISTANLSKIDLQIMWADKENNLYPLPLVPFDTASLKLAFLNKKLYKDTEK